MQVLVKRLVRKTLRKFGWELQRFDPATSEWAVLSRLLADRDIRMVLDVGANAGQFATNLRDAGYSGRIVSFEPLAEAHARLRAKARGDSNWIVAERMAIGDRDGEVEIHVAGNSVSSSVLAMLKSHTDFAPGSRYTGSETVPLAKLDSLVDKFAGPDEPLFIKLDVQGFEREVLRGANATLRRTAGLQVELSLVSLYEGQQLYQEAIDSLQRLGYRLWSLAPDTVDPRTGKLLQMDGIFLREKNEA